MKKKFLFLILILFYVSSCESTKNLGSLDFEVYHVNDIHGNIGSVEGVDFAKLSYKLNKTRETSDALYLDAGDLIAGGNIFASPSKGDAMIQIYNKMGVTAMTIGNHEFDYGFERLLELQEMANFPMLSANIKYKDKNEYPFERYTIKELKDGSRVGIFGLTTPETAYKTHPKNVEKLVFEDPNKVAKEMVDELLEEGVDYIIALTHLGTEGDFSTEKMLSDVSGIDLIIDGHSHTQIDKIEHVGNAGYVQTGALFKTVGYEHITRGEGDELSSISYELLTTIPNDANPMVVGIIDSINAQNGAITNQVVATTPIVLDGVRENVRTKPTNLGTLIAESMKARSGADLAFINGGGIRTSIDVGDITMAEVLTVLPFGNTLRVIEVKGSVIKEALEHGLDTLPVPAGHFPQTAGIEYVLNVNAPIGGRASNIKINGVLLDPEKTYKMAVADFVADGGDGYTMLKGAKVIAEYETIDQIFIDYINKNPIR